MLEVTSRLNPQLSQDQVLSLVSSARPLWMALLWPIAL